MTGSAVASARKSLGEYKPLIRFADGRTEVVEQSPERVVYNSKTGETTRNRYARGTTYTSREDAVAAAQELIEMRRANAQARYNHYLAGGMPVERLKWIAGEIALWGGEVVA